MILNNSFFGRYLYLCEDISRWKCEVLWFECVTFLFPKINGENKVNKVSFEISTVENNDRNM